MSGGGGELSNRSEWELSKENIQPLKRGRKMANLSAAFGDSNEYQSRIHQEIQGYEAAIRTYEGDDALEVWYRYFVWICENFPTGGKDQHVLLERCITVFKDEEKYKNDERYLKIWLRYADLSTDPDIVFEYMHSQGICLKLTSFYEYWTYVFEKQGNLKKADELFNLGKEKNAVPIEKLQRLHRAFEMRLAEHLDDSSMESSNSGHGQQRTALVGLKAHGKKGTVGFKRTGNAIQAFKQGGISQHKQSTNSKNPGFTVFNEDAKEIKSIASSTGDWQIPPTRKTVTKENTQKPGKWNEAKMQQGVSIPVNEVGSKPSFTVHEDEESHVNPPCTPQHHHVLDQVLSSRKPAKDATNELLKSIAKINKDDDKFKVMYCKEKIYAGAKEFSFEQLRATRILTKLAGAPWSSLYPAKKDANVQYKVMYPKQEVYPFDSGEQPYDEILLKRYYKRKEKKLKAAERSNEATVSDSQMEIKSPLHSVQQMDIGSCHKIVQSAQPTGVFEVYDDTQDNCSDNQPARRGLSFQSKLQSETPIINSEPVNQGLYQQPFSDLRHPLEMLKTTQTTAPLSERIPSHDPGIQQGLEPSYGHFQSTSQSKNRTPGGVDIYMASPTVTMNTKAAQDVVMAMFNNPLGVGNDEDITWMKHHSVPSVEQDFEAAFKDDKTEKLCKEMAKPQGFTIFDETDTGNSSLHTRSEEENEENRPPLDYVQEKTHRPIMGVLQPSHGIPVCPLEEEEDEDEGIIEDSNMPPHTNYSYHGSKIIDAWNKTTSNNTEDLGFLTNTNFKMAARMASTPYSQGMEPPSFVLSTIKPPKNNEDMQEPMEYVGNTFACTPNKALSPIFERSDEDTKSTASTVSSNASSSRGSVSQRVSNPIKLESVIEDRQHVLSTSNSRHMQNHLSASTQKLTYSQAGGQIDRISELNPFSDCVTDQLLLNIDPPISTYKGYFSCNEDLPNIAEKIAIDLGEDDLYQVRHRIGSGAFAKVYCAYKLSPDLGADDNDRSEVTLKVQSIPNNWEFYLCCQLHSRIDAISCPSQMHKMFMNPSNIYNYNNGSVLVDQYSPLGTLLDVANMYKTTSQCSEEIAMSVTITLLHMLITMHSCGIIHGDIKPDNILLLESGSSKEINLKLIDFGRGIDMHLFPKGTMFNVNCFTEGFQCIEMKTGLPWSLQVDTYGLLGVLYCLINGDYMKVYQKGTRWTQNRSFKRHWNVELWNNLFDLLLNTPNPSEMAANCDELLQEFLAYREILYPTRNEILELETQMKSKVK